MLYFKYNKLLSEFDLINKFYFSNQLNIPALESSELSVSVRDSDNDVSNVFSRSSLLLELITSQKPKVKRFKTTIKGRLRKRIVFVNSVILRKSSFFFFYYFFFFFIYLNLKTKFLVINKNINHNQYIFSIKDISIFPGVAEHFIKWDYPIHFSLLSSRSKNKMIMELILRNYGIEVLI